MSEPKPFSIHPLGLGSMENLVYLIHDHKTGRAAVVDPAWEVDEILALAQDQGLTITDILLTHSHYDHVNGIDEVLAHCDAQLHLLEAEARFWGGCPDFPALHHDGDIVRLGETPIKILHTPGHTPGSACYYLDGHLISGDTLFVFGCGRCDLPGGDPEVLYDTLMDLSGSLPSGTIIHPGHDYGETRTSTMAVQEAGNPFLHFDRRDDFVTYRMAYHDAHRHAPYGAVKRGTEMRSC